MVLFMLSFFEVPKGDLEKIDYYRSKSFWQNDNQKKNMDYPNEAYFASQRTKGEWYHEH
jgi:hypothetical protein